MEAAEVASRSYKGNRLMEGDRNPADIEVPLQTITVQFPEEPLLVNGSPYGFEVDSERLCQAINTVRRTFWRPGQFDPLSLRVSLGESLLPKIVGTDKTEESKLFNREDKTLRVELPSEVSKSNTPEKLLVGQVENALNLDLAMGIEQVRQEKTVIGHRISRYRGGVAVGAAVGEGVGIVTGSNSLETVLVRGTGGAIIAGVLATGATVAKIIYTDWRLQRKAGLDTVEYAAQRRLEKKGIGKDLGALFEESIIKLVPSHQPRKPLSS